MCLAQLVDRCIYCDVGSVTPVIQTPVHPFILYFIIKKLIIISDVIHLLPAVFILITLVVRLQLARGDLVTDPADVLLHSDPFSDLSMCLATDRLLRSCPTQVT